MDLIQKEHKISAETEIRQMTCYILNLDSHSNLLLNTISFVWFNLFGWRTLNWKAYLRHRAVSLRQHGFLVSSHYEK